MADKIKAALANNTYIDTLFISGKEFKIKRICDFDKLLNVIDDEEFNRDERLPYWAELWPSSIALAKNILQNQKLFRDKAVIEIGCGLGLAGMAAHFAGGNILFTDYDPLALEFTRHNFKLNYNSDAQTHLLDWRNPRIDRKFDVFIAADVLYEKRFIKPVLNSIDNLVYKNGIAIIAEPNRSIAIAFFDKTTEFGWRRDVINETIELDKKQHKVSLHIIRLC